MIRGDYKATKPSQNLSNMVAVVDDETFSSNMIDLIKAICASHYP